MKTIITGAALVAAAIAAVPAHAETYTYMCQAGYRAYPVQLMRIAAP